MRISVIIPTYFEENTISRLLDFLCQPIYRSQIEVIIVDGGSKDNTVAIARQYPVKLITAEKASRPHQMNLGAKHAMGEIFYFVHADVQLVSSFVEDIEQALQTCEAGCYRYVFDSSHTLLKINAFFTRFPMMWCRGGDQTLFITRNLFEQLGGFDEYFEVMEDFDLIRRIKEHTRFHIIPKSVIVSARKYDHNSYLKVQWVNLKAFRMFKRGVTPIEIRKYYKQALNLGHY